MIHPGLTYFYDPALNKITGPHPTDRGSGNGERDSDYGNGPVMPEPVSTFKELLK